ncbi:MAG: AraC family transcriptional regulator [Desulfobacterales bacterium]|nr:AraC family transcriptional regulator [Desulfobacterales bacterium]
METQTNIPPRHDVVYPGKNGAPGEKQPFHLQENHPGPCEYSWHNESEQGSSRFTMMEIQPGFELWFYRCRFQHDVLMSCRDMPPSVSFSFCFSGESVYRMPHGGSIYFRPHSQQLCVYPYPEVNVHMAKDVVSSRLFVLLSPEQFGNCFDGDMDALAPPVRKIAEKGPSDLFLHTEPISPMAGMLLEQIQNCPFQGTARKRFFEGCAFNIMALQLKSLSRRFASPGTAHQGIHPDEQKRVQRVKELIENHLDNPPSLTELAREAALSAPRLNQSFRRLYGTTIFDYLRRERFNRARSMLEQGLTVTEASLAVGYESLASFSISFKKRFGYAPSRYLSQK